MTSLYEPLDITTIWQEGWDNATIADIIQSIEGSTIAYETFGYFNLFFGQYGVFNYQQDGGANSTNSTESELNIIGAELQNPDSNKNLAGAFTSNGPATQGFLQGDDSVAATQEGEETGETEEPVDALDEQQVFQDTDTRIKYFSAELACSINQSVNG